MSATNDLVGKKGFPDSLPFEFSAEELEWLRHQPDPVVRPGGLPYPASIPSADAASIDHNTRERGCEIDLFPWKTDFPLGAPVRIFLSITNCGRKEIRIPQIVGFSHGGVNVKVTGPDGTVLFVTPNLSVCDESDWMILSPKQSAWSAMTLLRGPQGALFPESGRYRVEVKIRVRQGRQAFAVQGRSRVSISASPLVGCRKLAIRALGCVELQAAMVLGGDLSPQAARLMTTLLGDRWLRSHYAFVEAKRISTTWNGRGNLSEIAGLISSDAEMTPKEMSRAFQIVRTCLENGSRAFGAAKSILEVLNSKLGDQCVPSSVQSELKTQLLSVTRLLRTKEPALTNHPPR